MTAVSEGPENYLDRYSLLLIAGNSNSNLVITPLLNELSPKEVARQIDRVTYMVCADS